MKLSIATLILTALLASAAFAQAPFPTPPDETPVGPPDGLPVGPPDETPVGPPDGLPVGPPDECTLLCGEEQRACLEDVGGAFRACVRGGIRGQEDINICQEAARSGVAGCLTQGDDCFALCDAD
jgi:hypothetical protein